MRRPYLSVHEFHYVLHCGLCVQGKRSLLAFYKIQRELQRMADAVAAWARKIEARP